MNTSENASLNAPARPQPTTQELFAREHLPAPPVPAHLAAALSLRGESLLSTRPLKESPYNLGPFLGEVAARSDMPAYAVVGFDGHGLNSWAAHYYLVSDGIAMFIQLRWGGAYLDPEPARADITDLFEWAAKLQSKVELAVQREKIPPGWRLQVSASRLGHAGWRWLEPGKDNAAVPWNPAGGMKAALLQMLDDVLSGKLVL